jgi:hypothetical protein
MIKGWTEHSLELSLNFSKALSDTDGIGEDGLLVVVLVSLGDGVQLICLTRQQRQSHSGISLCHSPGDSLGSGVQRLTTSSIIFFSSSVGCLSANPNKSPRTDSDFAGLEMAGLEDMFLSFKVIGVV